MNNWLRVVVVGSCLALGAPTLAADLEGEDLEEATSSANQSQKWRLEGGVGTALRPARRGDNRYLFSPFPIARLSYGELFEASTRDGISYAAVPNDVFRFGPELELDRKERQSTRRFGPIATTFGTGGAGGFAEMRLPADSRLRLDVTEGVFGREGLRAAFATTKTFALSEPLALDLGWKTTGGDRRYVTSAYGLPAARPAPPLPFLPATSTRGSGGVAATGPTLGLSYAASSFDTLTTNLEVSRTIGSA
jgi:outer membrane scaffolding protein for murein synthesis (MipA/OmpV family)